MPDERMVRLNAALEGRYRVERRIGEGGMATVYLADDLRHERKVALKVLKPELAAVVGADRFLAEIKTTATLQHPHVLPLFDSGEADGFLYYVMPYVEGETLRARLDREHQLPVEEAVAIATDVAEALDHAHRHGVVHRDVKPANILLQDGKAVVSDFGIALAVGAGRAGRLTETGLSLGTPYYMSPEQATGDRHVGAPTDVYALGCVLYEMLVGEPPYTGSTPQAILGRILSGEFPTASKQRPSVPANVDAAIRRALERVPADRFTSTRALANALVQGDFRHGSAPEEASVPAAVAVWRRLALGLGALATLLVAVAGWMVTRPEPPVPVVRSSISLSEDLVLEAAPGAALALSPDGSQVTIAATTGGVTRLWQRYLAELALTPMPGTEGARTPVYAPDGSAVAFVSTGRVMVAPLTGEPPYALVPEGVAGGASGLSWSDDGWLYYRAAGESGLRRVRVDGGGVGEVVTTASAVHPDAIRGGRGVLVTHSESGGDTRIVLLDLERGEERELFEGRTARYAPWGQIVFTSADGTLLTVPFDARRLEVTGPVRTLLGGVRTDPLAGSQFAISPAGTLLYHAGPADPGLSLAVVDLEGNRRDLPLAPRSYSMRGPTWSPDGRSVVFSSDLQIYTYDTRLNTTPRQVTFEGTNLAPVYSPDGRRIAFSSFRTGTRGVDLFVKELSSDEPPRHVLEAEGAQFATQWPNDTLLLFGNAGEPGTGDLWMLDLSDPESAEAKPYLTSDARLSDFVASPDGRYAAYLSDESGTEEVYVRAFPDPGEPTIVSRGGGGIPFWSPDGGTLFYGTRIGRMFVAARLARDPALRVVSLDTLFGDPGIGQIPAPGPTLDPSGRHLVLAVFPTSGSADAAASGGGGLVLVQGFRELSTRVAGAR